MAITLENDDDNNNNNNNNNSVFLFTSFYAAPACNCLSFTLFSVL
jgi:hypothetical protein